MTAAASAAGRASGFGGFGSGGSGSSGPSGGSGASGSAGSSGSAGTTQGYAIPINTALSIAKQIKAGQESSTVHIGQTAFIGIGIGTGTGTVQGVPIASAQPGTPAANAGIAEGDTVTALDGKSVSTGTDVQDILIGHHPGDKVSITWVDTAGQSHTATLTLSNGPAA